MVSNDDRGRGILNKRQREYLRGESDIEEKSPTERSIRQSIRENFRNAVLDFPILLEYLDDRDLEMVLDPGIMYNDVTSAISHGIGLLYLDDREVFETRVRHGIVRAEARKGWKADPLVNIEVDRDTSVEDLATKLEEEGVETDLTVAELNVLLERGEIDPELYGRIVERRLSEGGISEGLALTNIDEDN